MSDVTGKYTLKTPIARTTRGPDGEKTETIAEVTIRPPVTRDLRVTDRVDGEAAKGIALLAHLSGLTISEIDALPLPEFKAMMKIVEGFTDAGPETGGTSSAA